MAANLVSVILSALPQDIFLFTFLPAQLVITLLALGAAIWLTGRLKRLTEPQAYRIFRM